MLVNNCLMKYNIFWPIFEFSTAKCSSSLPGSRDKKNPIYVAPSMNSPVKRPEGTLKEKKLFKLTGDTLGMEIMVACWYCSTFPSKESGSESKMENIDWGKAF